MPDYRIIVTPDAIKDLTGLRATIADVLLAPETALAYIQTIRREIGSLAHMSALPFLYACLAQSRHFGYNGIIEYGGNCPCNSSGTRTRPR